MRIVTYVSGVKNTKYSAAFRARLRSEQRPYTILLAPSSPTPQRSCAATPPTARRRRNNGVCDGGSGRAVAEEGP
eukprot:6174388-Pleurochrysis_carterae.AAC.1